MSYCRVGLYNALVFVVCLWALSLYKVYCECKFDLAHLMSSFVFFYETVLKIRIFHVSFFFFFPRNRIRIFYVKR